MKPHLIGRMAILCLVTIMIITLSVGGSVMSQERPEKSIQLPKPSRKGGLPLEQTLSARRSVRQYESEPLTLEQVGQLLWAAQGITHARGFRTTPSAGALYPLETYVIAGNVEGLDAGVYHYAPHGHSLTPKGIGDKRNDLARAALGQSAVKNAPATFLFTAFYERTTVRYGQRGIQYVHMEAGHSAQNIALQAVSISLGTVMIGAFQDDSVKNLLHLSPGEIPLYLIPVGR